MGLEVEDGHCWIGEDLATGAALRDLRSGIAGGGRAGVYLDLYGLGGMVFSLFSPNVLHDGVDGE